MPTKAALETTERQVSAPLRLGLMVTKDEYERHIAVLKRQISEWGQVRQTAEQNVERLRQELGDFQDAYIDQHPANR